VVQQICHRKTSSSARRSPGLCGTPNMSGIDFLLEAQGLHRGTPNVSEIDFFLKRSLCLTHGLCGTPNMSRIHVLFDSMKPLCLCGTTNVSQNDSFLDSMAPSSLNCSIKSKGSIESEKNSIGSFLQDRILPVLTLWSNLDSMEPFAVRCSALQCVAVRCSALQGSFAERDLQNKRET